jgi:hypothetical protein
MCFSIGALMKKFNGRSSRPKNTIELLVGSQGGTVPGLSPISD